MAADNHAEAEPLRGFEAAVAGAEFADLDGLARPELRRPPRNEVAIYRVRVDLDHAQPPIWRRLDLRSDLPLDVVHQVLQAAFDWTDSHLHRFSLGGHPFGSHSQVFLCPFDEQEGDGLLPASEVRLDETLQGPGDVLHYLYDYGDSWELTLRLEEILPASPESLAATALGGQRAAPPEDCGGLTDAASLAKILDDPARFELDEINRALRGPCFVLRECGVDPRLVDLVNRLQCTRAGKEVADRVVSLVSQPMTLGAGELAASLRAYRWFLDRAKGSGIPLTSAGYLKPDDVAAASKVVPAMGDWIGANNREVHAGPLLCFRRTLQATGLLRKHKGTLVLTRAGAEAQRDPSKLWNHLASRLLPTDDDTFEAHATLLLLFYAGTSSNSGLALAQVAAALTELGWRHRDGRILEGYELYDFPTIDVLRNISDQPASRRDRLRITSAAATLARAALRHQRIAAS